jgi:hypothetical protein
VILLGNGAGKAHRDSDMMDAAMNQAIVQTYVDRVNAALWEAADFEAVFHDLQHDKAVKKDEALAITKALVGSIDRKARKDSLLAEIRKLFERVQEQQAKRRYMAGRIAG